MLPEELPLSSSSIGPSVSVDDGDHGRFLVARHPAGGDDPTPFVDRLRRGALTARHFFDILRPVVDTAKLAGVAEELRAVVKNAFAEPEELIPQIPLLLGLDRINAEVDDGADALDRVAVLRRLVLPDYLARIGEAPEARAFRAMFVIDEHDFWRPSMSDLYYRAVDHLDGVSISAWERRRFPKLLRLFAARVIEFDAIDARSRGADRDLAAFWGLARAREVSLVFPELTGPLRPRNEDMPSNRHIHLARFADTDTLVELRTFLARLFPRLVARHLTWDEATDALTTKPVINVGGIYYNKLTAQLLDLVASPITQIDAPVGEPDALLDNITGTKYQPEFSGELVTYDYGLFVTGVNPHNKTDRLMIINGVLTHGVLGACRAFTDPVEAPKNIAHVRSALDEDRPFAALMRVPVVADTVVAPRLYDSDLVALYPIDHSDK